MIFVESVKTIEVPRDYIETFRMDNPIPLKYKPTRNYVYD